MGRHHGDSFSYEVIKRILLVLSENEKMKKTGLAGKAGINYDMCIKYTKFLSKLGWIEKTLDDSLSLTPLGRQNLLILSSDDPTGSDTGSLGIANNLLPATSDAGIGRMKAIPSNSDSDRLPPASFALAATEYHSANGSNVGRKNGSRNVMIVDDDVNTLHTYKAFLSSSGCKVSTFSNSIDALKDFAENSLLYHLVILDIRMPKINGLQLFQTLKAMNRGLKVIFLSSLDAAPELLSIYPEVKPQEILRKPVERRVFISTVQTALG